VDPISAAKLWMAIRPIKRLKERRKAKKAGQALPAEAEVSMNSTVLTQIVLMFLRHAMTALGPLGVTMTDDALMQIAAVLVTVLGLGWSAMRKLKAAKPAA
jgi:hypothetical protein